MDSFTVLISSAGRRVELLEGFRFALRNLGLQGRVLAADMSPLSSAYQLADHGLQVPRCTSPQFVPTLLDICETHGVRLLIPTLDPELPVYAAHKQDFANVGTTVAISSPEVISIGADKTKTHAWLRQHGLPTVRQVAGEAGVAEATGWGFPLIVKPAHGSASVGVRRVESREELEITAKGPDAIIQSIAPGIEYTIDCLTDRAGRLLCAVPRRRLEVRSGEVSKAVVVRSEVLERLAGRVCEALPGPYGALNIQVFLDAKSQQVNVIEINPRFGGGFPLSLAAGADYPRWLIEETLGLPSTVQADSIRDGLIMLRYDKAVFVDGALVGV